MTSLDCLEALGRPGLAIGRRLPNRDKTLGRGHEVDLPVLDSDPVRGGRHRDEHAEDVVGVTLSRRGRGRSSGSASIASTSCGSTPAGRAARSSSRVGSRRSVQRDVTPREGNDACRSAGGLTPAQAPPRPRGAVPLLLEPALRVECGHRPRARGCHGLTVGVVLDIPGCENARNVRIASSAAP